MVTIPLFESTLAPRTLVLDPPISDAQLEALCLRSDPVQIERTSEGVIRMNPPTSALTSDGNAEITHQLRVWWKTHERGRVFDSNAGFFLKDGSLLSPDAEYALPEQMMGLTKAELARMPRLCTAFVVESLSQSDSLGDTRKKMESWIANGAQLGWLIDPYRQCVEIFAPNKDVVTTDAAQVPGSGPVEGFVFDTSAVWRCFEV